MTEINTSKQETDNHYLPCSCHWSAAVPVCPLVWPEKNCNDSSNTSTMSILCA